MAYYSGPEDPAEQPVSLYLDLLPGHTADLEVVARAALAFAAAVKEAAFILDPSIEVSLEFRSGTEGSLSLNTIIRRIKKAVVPDTTTLKALGYLALIWFASDVRTYGVGEILDRMLKGDPRHHLSDSEIERITTAVTKAQNAKVANEHVQEVFRQLEEDPAIRGVGATMVPGQRPTSIIPRDDFPTRAAGPLAIETTPEERTRTTTEHIILVSPVLIRSNRRWRVLTRHGEIGVTIKDEKFLNDILEGRRPITMRAGILLDVKLEITEEKQEGVWVVTDRAIKKVLRVRRPPRDPDLFASPKNRKNRDD